MNDIGTVRGSLRWRRHLRLSVRTLVILVLVIGGWVGWTVRNAQQQRAAVDAIRSSGGWVRYDWDYRPSGVPPTESMMWPKWLEDFLGPDYLHDVTRVTTGNHDGLADADMLRIGVLTQLDYLVISGSRTTNAGLANLGKLYKLKTLILDASSITDAGLVHLTGLTNLRDLTFTFDKSITDAGLVHLKGLDSLERLHLADSRVSGAGLPRATIIY